MEFYETLNRLINSKGINPHLNSKVKSIKFDGEVWHLELENERSFQANNIVMSAASRLGYIEYNGLKTALKYKLSKFTHYHLVIDGVINKPISYVRVLKHPFIHRVSDVTNQLNDKSTGLKVFIIGVFADKIPNYDNEDEIAETLLAYLKKKKIVSGSSALNYYQSNTYPSYSMDSEHLPEIQNMNHLKFMKSSDLIYGINRMLKSTDQ